MCGPTARRNANLARRPRSPKARPTDAVPPPVAAKLDGVGAEALPAEAPPITVCRIAADLMVLLLPATEKRAVMEWSPAVRSEVANVAWPPANSTVPSGVEPSKNVTLPVVGEPGPTTVKVNTTTWPSADGLEEETTVAPADVAPVPPPAGATVVGALPLPVVGVEPAVVVVVTTLVVVGAPVVGVTPVVEVEPPVEEVVEVVDAVAGKQAPFSRTVSVPTQVNVLVTVAVHVSVLAPVVADRLHWSIVTLGAESDATPAVAVQVTVPVAPELLH